MAKDNDQDVTPYLNKWTEQKVSYMKRDLLTYAVGIGCTELNFTYEGHDNFAAFPTYPIVLPFKGTDQEVVSFPSPSLMEGPQRPPLKGMKTILDGERYIEQVSPLDPEGGTLTLKGRVLGCHKRGTGTSVETEELLVDSAGKVVYKMISGQFFVGGKGFKDGGETNSEKVDPPSRPPDAVLAMPTSPYQAQVYRLSGDYNPLHVDPQMATMMGFPGPKGEGEPILHGLCTLGVTARAAVARFCGNDPAKFKAIKGRFSSPVVPGQTLLVEMWKEPGDKIILVSKVKETGNVAINNAYVLLHPTSKL